MDTDSGAAFDIGAASKEGTRKIIDKILSDARSEAQDIRSYADNQVQETLSNAMNESNAKREEMLKKGKQEALTEKNRILSQARLDMRKRILEAKEREITKALDGAMEILTKHKAIPGYGDVMAEVAREACISIGGGDLSVSTDAAGAEALEPVRKTIEKDVHNATGKKTSITIVTDGAPGVVVTSAGGIVVDNTFATRLERRKREIRKGLADMMF
jgi:V/A-type H+-transporting ATPase subunit E